MFVVMSGLGAEIKLFTAYHNTSVRMKPVMPGWYVCCEDVARSTVFGRPFIRYVQWRTEGRGWVGALSGKPR